MSCEALNLLIAAALLFSAAYLPIVFAFYAIVRHMVITGNTTISSILRSSNVLSTKGSEAQTVIPINS